jgi:hypothetical protein
MSHGHYFTQRHTCRDDIIPFKGTHVVMTSFPFKGTHVVMTSFPSKAHIHPFKGTHVVMTSFSFKGTHVAWTLFHSKAHCRDDFIPFKETQVVMICAHFIPFKETQVVINYYDMCSHFIRIQRDTSRYDMCSFHSIQRDTSRNYDMCSHFIRIHETTSLPMFRGTHDHAFIGSTRKGQPQMHWQRKDNTKVTTVSNEQERCVK